MDIINLNEEDYREIDSEIIDNKIEENNEKTYEINLIIILINRILNQDIKLLPPYSSNYCLRFKEYREEQINKLHYLKIVLERFKEENSEEKKETSFINDVKNLLNEEEKKEDKLEIKKSKEEIDFLIIKNLISKFLKLHFKEKKTTLNERAKTDIEKTYGYYYWDKKKIARHLVTKEYTKVLNDKYDMEYSKGKVETVPLAFYFDLSGSMENYTMILSQIAYNLLKNKIKVLVGFNETIYYQINDLDIKISLNDLVEFFETYNENTKIKYEEINEKVDSYLKRKLCEKCVIFSDNDSYKEVCNLSNDCDVYLMYFETYGIRIDRNFKGCVFKIENEKDLFDALRSISKTNYQVLKQKSLKLKERRL